MSRPGVPTADHRKFRVLELHEQGKTVTEIVEEVGCSRGSVSKWTRDQALRDRWLEHRGAQQARAAFTGEPVQSAPAPPEASAGASVAQLRVGDDELADGALPAAQVRRLLEVIADGCFTYDGERYDFGLAGDLARVPRTDLVALQAAASRGDERAGRTLAVLVRAAAGAIHYALSKLKKGAAERESLRLWLDRVLVDPPQGAGAGGRSPVAHLTTKQLRALRSKAG